MLPLHGQENMADNVDGAERFTPITDPDVIGAALARIVKSPEFNDSKRSVQFLQYIVKKHQNGHASEINGTTHCSRRFRGGH